MPWKEHLTVDLRKKFVFAASSPGANVAGLCREYGISRKNGYKWLQRYKLGGESGLDDRSRRPRKVSGVEGETVLRIIELRRANADWGAKKLRELLVREGAEHIPSSKTIARILGTRPTIRRLTAIGPENRGFGSRDGASVWSSELLRRSQLRHPTTPGP